MTLMDEILDKLRKCHERGRGCVVYHSTPGLLRQTLATQLFVDEFRIKDGQVTGIGRTFGGINDSRPAVVAIDLEEILAVWMTHESEG